MNGFHFQVDMAKKKYMAESMGANYWIKGERLHWGRVEEMDLFFFHYIWCLTRCGEKYILYISMKATSQLEKLLQVTSAMFTYSLSKVM